MDFTSCTVLLVSVSVLVRFSFAADVGYVGANETETVLSSSLPRNLTYPLWYGNYTLQGAPLNFSQPAILGVQNTSVSSVGPVIPLTVIWYGNFSSDKRSSMRDFLRATLVPKASAFASDPLLRSSLSLAAILGAPPIAAKLNFTREISFPAKGKTTLVDSDTQALLVRSLQSLELQPFSLYMVMVSAEVRWQPSCMNSCALPSRLAVLNRTLAARKGFPYTWAAGDHDSECPHLCAWPSLDSSADMGGSIINLAYALNAMFDLPIRMGTFFPEFGTLPLEVASQSVGLYAVREPHFQRTDSGGRNPSNSTFLMPAVWNPFAH